MANSVDLEEVAHYEPPRQDLHCLQIYLLSSLVLKELKVTNYQCKMFQHVLTLKEHLSNKKKKNR